jgi:hypothetical protein
MVADLQSGTTVMAKMWSCDPHTIRRTNAAMAELSRVSHSTLALLLVQTLEQKKPDIIFACCTELYDGATRKLKLYQSADQRSLFRLVEAGADPINALQLAKRVTSPSSSSTQRTMSTELISGRMMFCWLERGSSQLRALEFPLPPARVASSNAESCWVGCLWSDNQ